MTVSHSAEYGTYFPSSLQEQFRAIGRHLPYNYAGRKLASLLLGPAGGRARRPFDVRVFNSQKVRLHPYDNICEKRVYLTPQHWDPAERALLAEHIGAHKSETFAFADIGANAGLYTFFVRAECMRMGKRLRAICVEPAPEMVARLEFNRNASRAQADIKILPFAATADDGPVAFSIDAKNRGMSHIKKEGSITVGGRSLLSLLSGVSRIDAMKIDIEGAEHQVLKRFFETAPQSLWPRLLLVETSHEAPGRSARSLTIERGYRAILDTKLNCLLTL